MIITSKLSDNELLEAIHKAAAQYSKLIGNEYLVIGKNKNSNYFWFQCRFEKKNFMHLLGIIIVQQSMKKVRVVLICCEFRMQNI